MKLLVVVAIFSLILLFLVVLAGLLEQYWRAYQAEQATKVKDKDVNQSAVSGFVDHVAQWVAQLRALVQPRPQQSEKMATLFHEWVARELNRDRDLQSWLLALPQPGIALLTEHIAAFCHEMNFDLNWLLTEQVKVAPELKQAMQAVIIDYCRACQKAVPAQQQANLFSIYQRLLQNPNGREERAWGRTLYAALVAKGLVLAPKADSPTMTEQSRQEQICTAIQQVAAKDWAQFARMLQAAVTPDAADGAANQTPGHHQSAPNGVSDNGVANHGVAHNGHLGNNVVPQTAKEPL